MAYRKHSAGPASDSAAGTLAAPATRGLAPPRGPHRRGALLDRDCGLSFVGNVVTSRGDFIERRHFDVPEQLYDEGLITGICAAAEQLRLLATGDAAVQQQLVHTLRTVGSTSYYSGKFGAADGFLQAMVQMLSFAASQVGEAPFAAWLVQLSLQRRSAQERKAEFVQRMRRARTAKHGAPTAASTRIVGATQ